MAERSWKELYDSDGVDVVEKDTYAIEVTTAEPHQGGKRVVFLTLNVLEGPSAGKKPQTTLYLPDPAADKFRGQLFNFKKRIAGFDIGAALSQMDPEGDITQQLAILADAIQGQRAYAEIGKQTEGEYAGNNELLSTKPLGAPAATTAVPQEVTAAAVAESTNGSADVEELRARLAAAEAAKDTVAVGAPAEGLAGEVPF